jgi:hypothetical protein
MPNSPAAVTHSLAVTYNELLLLIESLAYASHGLIYSEYKYGGREQGQQRAAAMRDLRDCIDRIRP